jgi:apolipoprotein N-acyltransferase
LRVRQIHSSAWLLILLSAVLQVLIFPLPGVYVLSWVALAPLVIALLRARPAGELEIPGLLRLRPASPPQGFLLGYLCGILWYAGTCYWVYDTMRRYGGLGASAAVLMLVLFCCYLGLYHGLFGLLITLIARSPRDYRRALVLAPFFWIAVELMRTRVTGFPWNLLGTAEVNNSALCGLAGLTGVYGVSFEIGLVNVAVAAAFLIPREKRMSMLVAALAAAAVLQAGSLVEVPAARTTRTALLVQQNVPVAADWTADHFQQTLSDLAGLTEKAVTSGPSGKFDLIVWPESPAPFFTNDPRFRTALTQVATQTELWTVAGTIGVEPVNRANETVFNSAVLISPSGEWTARYDKVHLVPFGEYLPFPRLFAFAGGLTKEVGQFEHGTLRKPLNAGGELLGVFICYESIFPDEVRRFANNGAQVFVNISNDGWYGDSGAYAQHLNQTRMRAIENNRWLLSATDTGVTASIDPAGRIVERLPRKERAALAAPYALTSVTTFYTRHGDWFAYACAIISLGALIVRFASPKIQKKAPSS